MAAANPFDAILCALYNILIFLYNSKMTIQTTGGQSITRRPIDRMTPVTFGSMFFLTGTC